MLKQITFHVGFLVVYETVILCFKQLSPLIGYLPPAESRCSVQFVFRAAFRPLEVCTMLCGLLFFIVIVLLNIVFFPTLSFIREFERVQAWQMWLLYVRLMLELALVAAP